MKPENKSITLVYTKKSQTIICPHCEYEFVLTVVIRPMMRNKELEANADPMITPATTCLYCPDCGRPFMQGKK